MFTPVHVFSGVDRLFSGPGNVPMVATGTHLFVGIGESRGQNRLNTPHELSTKERGLTTPNNGKSAPYVLRYHHEALLKPRVGLRRLSEKYMISILILIQKNIRKAL